MIHSTMGGMHLAAALIAIATGLAVVLLPKGHAPHRLLGLVYSFAMLMTCTSALLLYGMTGHFGLFHFFAVLSLINILVGISQAIPRRGDWMRRHLIWMGWSYLGLLAAASVEASVRLPVFAHISNSQTFLLGGVISAVILLIGWAMMPRWTSRALENFTVSRAETKARSVP
jgi:uncharacterized membrane protein